MRKSGEEQVFHTLSLNIIFIALPLYHVGMRIEILPLYGRVASGGGVKAKVAATDSDESPRMLDEEVTLKSA